MYPSMHWAGGFVSKCALGGGGGLCIPVCNEQGGVCPRGCLLGGVYAKGRVSAQGEVSVQRGVRTESQTPVKTLPCHNYVANGNNLTIGTLSRAKSSTCKTICLTVADPGFFRKWH